MNVLTISLRSAVAISLLAGCFSRTSDRYACELDSDCTGGRTCNTSGFCVLPGGDDDGGVDGSGSDAGDPCMNFTARHFQPCMIPKPTGPMSMNNAGTYIFNTTDGSLVDTMQVQSTPPGKMVDNYWVVSVESLSLGPTSILRVRGTYPLVIAVWGTADVNGTIDVSSTSTTLGAGSLPYATPSTFCAQHLSGTAAENGQGGGGGGGGAMQSNGGTGGQGAAGADNGGVGAIGAATIPPMLAAGCPADKGGTGGGSAGGVGGLGGGAIQITAKTSITISGTGKISAGGQGGRPGTGANGGGGGGGAGGMIGLESPMLTVMQGAVLAANGGGGGQGGGDQGGTAQAGQDGQLTATAATGGTGGSGGVGGTGSVSVTAGVNGALDGAGGGGGGGGAGYITIKSPMRNDSAGLYSPLAISVQ